MGKSKYLKRYGTEEICSNCAVIASYTNEEADHYRMLADRFDLKLFDIGTHVWAANMLGKKIEDYLAGLPKCLEEYTAYFKNTGMESLAETVITDPEAMIWPGYK